MSSFCFNINDLGRYVVGITGAGGSIYCVQLIEELTKRDNEVYLVITNNGKKVLEYELEINLEKWVKSIAKNINKPLFPIPKHYYL